MRDPLFLVPIRYKLPLTFAFLCLVALALGAYVVTTTAGQGLAATLISTFVYGGIAVALLTLILLLSRRFLLKPLTDLESAAARAAEDLRQREEEIRFERDRLNTVIHSMEDGLFILDRDGEPTLANAAAQDVLEEFRRGRCADSTHDCGHGARVPRSCIECLADYRRPAQHCVVVVGTRTYDIHATPLRDHDGEEAGRIFVSRDITERMRQATQQAHQERMLVIGGVAAVMAHEMNNPLAAISMFSQMLLDSLDPSSPLHTHAEVVHRNTLSCKRTIRSLLDMATTSTSRPETFDVRDLVDDVVEFLRPLAERARAVLKVDAEANDGSIHADELQLRQALVNLVMNSIQAVGKGEEDEKEDEKGVVMIGTVDRGPEIVIRVHDKGPGIPEDLRERIFEPFFTTKPAGEGTGLGLPTTRRIVEAQGGRLNLCPRSGVGSTFEMIVPRQRQRPEALRVLQPPLTALDDIAVDDSAA